MKQEELQKMLEAIGRSGITVAGDLVLEKNVEYEVAGGESGGIGIQIVNGRSDAGSEAPVKKELNREKLARSIEHCQDLFWGKSAYAVVYCVCRDVYGIEPNQSAFERMIELLPYKNTREYECTPGTLANAFSDNNFYHDKIDKWDSMNVMERVIKLRDKLQKELEL